VRLVRVVRYHARTRDGCAGRVRVRSEGLGGMQVAREALVSSVPSPAAGAETPFEVCFLCAQFGWLDRYRHRYRYRSRYRCRYRHRYVPVACRHDV
jgi:hypothetical protein